jgi:hypothetical protein
MNTMARRSSLTRLVWPAAVIAVSAAIAIASVVAATPQAPARAATDPAGVIPFTPDRWTLGDGIAVVERRGVQSIQIPQSQNRVEALLKDVDFASGTIEFDAEGTHSMGPAIGFRRRDAKDLELFYLRPRPTCDKDVDCVQYAPFVKGVLLWDIYPELQAPARYVPGQWNRVKLVVSGERLKVWVNGGAPVLDVARLRGDTSRGGIAFSGPGFLANVTVTPGAVDGLSPKAGPDPTAADRRLVRAWTVSPVVPLAAGAAPDFASRPKAAAAWTPLPAETGGLVNISRRYGLPAGRSLVWLRTTLKAASATTTRASIGWNDEVWVYVNGTQVYADVNDYLKPELRKKPDGRLSLDNGSFALPLAAGDNEVIVGVANAFFGWGLKLRLDDTTGVTLAAPTP